ncbi:MAG: HPF/RaiA family ribosome-associated protein [Steroidobacteraceae bacterium]
MQAPLTVSFRHVDHSAALEERAQSLLSRLERLHERITRCHVVVEGPTAHHTKGAPFVVKIELAVPGEVLFASSAHHEEPTHDDVYVALNDAFENAKRQLQDAARHA